MEYYKVDHKVLQQELGNYQFESLYRLCDHFNEYTNKVTTWYNS